MKQKRLSKTEYLMIAAVFLICLAGALLLSPEKCPDEGGRLLLSDWIVKTGTLPTGNEPETMILNWRSDPVTGEMFVLRKDGFDGWGFSYALRPYLSAMIGAAFQKLVMLFTSSPRILLAAARMCSVLAVTLSCLYCLRFGRKVFAQSTSAVLFAVMICFTPQVIFLGMYQNNDSLSLCALCMMLYYLAEGYESKWSIRSCIGLGISFSVGLLSYYYIYGWLLAGGLFCIAAVLSDPEIIKKGSLIGRRAGLIVLICAVLAGWFFVRNAYLHNGDLLGITSEETSRTWLRQMGYQLHDYVNYREQGLSVREFLALGNHLWFRLTAESIVGMFGYMDIPMPRILYRAYGILSVGGILLYLAVVLRKKPGRRDRLLAGMMVLASVITVLLHFWQCYNRDFQPQGRYVISLLLLLGYITAYDFEHFPIRKAGKYSAVGLTVIWLCMFAAAAIGTMTKMLI